MTTNLSPFVVSRETVRQVALGVDRYQLMRQRYGRQTADLKRGPRGAGVRTTRPLERVELDHFLVDVHLLCDETGRRLNRPWLTLLVDHYSGLLLGYHLTFAPPSAASVLAALRHAILPKSEVAGAAWLACGIPDLLVVDNGLDLTSYGVREACAALGMDLLFTPVRSPWYKGTIERQQRTMNVRLIHWLPGTTLGRATSDLAYDGRVHVTLTFEVFKSLLEQYIVTVHNKTPRRGKEGTPERRFLEGIQQWPVRLPASQDEFDAAVALTRHAVLQQTGVWFLGLQYQNDALKTLWNQVPDRTRLVVKVNPLDLKNIKVLHPLTRAPISVDCVSPLAWPRSLAFHMAVRAQARSDARDPNQLRELAEAQKRLEERTLEAVANSKRTLRRMQAQLYKEAQRQEPQEQAEDRTVSPVRGDEEITRVFDKVFGNDKA